jgi:hypothetical protein
MLISFKIIIYKIIVIYRAKRFVALIGDSDTVKSDKFLCDLINYFE